MKSALLLGAMLAVTGGLGLGLNEPHTPYKYEGDQIKLTSEELEEVRGMDKKQRKAFMKKRRAEYAARSKNDRN